ncbi:hypothetical protein [Niabella drilacis]|uniref:Uncharacterized protein n=1 Tax=Niabella drilacis (strain DSM 25811 / CCM 8410 / CCUG 62505 / LMG 26954 / E90) TaxID=1285928 RepID=A0A1G6U791_NIADE|nr:hypothetical protein [Niabella drilacis]SDD37153.1 hypothetical protein SAMN04487894_108170 [Niabella drilacis]
MNIRIKILITALLALLFSCGKNNDETGSKTKAGLPAGGSWKLAAYTAGLAADGNGDGKTGTDFYTVILY